MYTFPTFSATVKDTVEKNCITSLFQSCKFSIICFHFILIQFYLCLIFISLQERPTVLP